MTSCVGLLLLLGACPEKPASPRDAMLALPVAKSVPGKRATIPKTMDLPGDVSVRTKDIAIRGLLTGGGTWTMTEHTVRELDVLAVEAGVVTRVRVSYPEETLDHRGVGARPRPPRVRGNAYLVTARDKELVVERELAIEREQLSAEEEQYVRNDVTGELGLSESSFDAVLGVPLESGRTIALSPAALAAQIGPGVTVRAAEARLVDVRGETAVIEIHYAGATDTQAFTSREVSEWSTTTGRLQRITGAAAFSDAEFANRVDGSNTYTYR